jgi:glutaredoxin
MTEKNERAQAWLDKIHAEHDRQIAQQWADDDTCRHAAEHIVIHELLSEIDQAKAQAESAVTPQVEQAVQALLDDFGRITDDQGCWSDAHVEDLERICRMHIQQAISTSLTGSRETPPSVVIALKELVEAVAREVDTEGKGGSGYLLARLTDARAALKAVPQDAAPRVSPQGQDAPLSCKVEGECLVIEIGIRTLAHAASYSEWANRYDEARADYRRSFAIIDLHEYAKDVALQMQHEAEDGSSLLTKLIDEAMEAAVDDGSMGTDDADVACEQFAPSETWAGAVPSPPSEESVPQDAAPLQAQVATLTAERDAWKQQYADAYWLGFKQATYNKPGSLKTADALVAAQQEVARLRAEIANRDAARQRIHDSFGQRTSGQDKCQCPYCRRDTEALMELAADYELQLHASKAQQDATAARLAQLQEVLKGVEWISVRGGDVEPYLTCPACFADHAFRGDHTAWCPLSAALLDSPSAKETA